MQIRTLRCYLDKFPKTIKDKFKFYPHNIMGTEQDHVFIAHLEPHDLPPPLYSFNDGRIFYNGQYIAAYIR